MACLCIHFYVLTYTHPPTYTYTYIQKLGMPSVPLMIRWQRDGFLHQGKDRSLLVEHVFFMQSQANLKHLWFYRILDTRAQNEPPAPPGVCECCFWPEQIVIVRLSKMQLLMFIFFSPMGFAKAAIGNRRLDLQPDPGNAIHSAIHLWKCNYWHMYIPFKWFRAKLCDV